VFRSCLVEAEIELLRRRDREDVVKDRIGVGEADRRADRDGEDRRPELLVALLDLRVDRPGCGLALERREQDDADATHPGKGPLEPDAPGQAGAVGAVAVLARRGTGG